MLRLKSGEDCPTSHSHADSGVETERENICSHGDQESSGTCDQTLDLCIDITLRLNLTPCSSL